MKKLIALLILIPILHSCDNKYPEYKELEHGIYLKLIALGDGELLNDNKFVRANISVEKEGSPVYQRKSIYPFELNSSSAFDQVFSQFSEGDSLSLKVPSLHLKESGIRFDHNYEGDLDVHIKIEEYLSEQEHALYVEENDFEMIEQLLLNKYLKQEAIDVNDMVHGIHKEILKKGDGPVAKNGDVIYVHYIGKFISGIEFDNTYHNEEPFEFTLGTPGQVIEGLEIALKGMKEGDKTKIIIPSQLAFGEYGSSTGLIPPFTTVIYNLEIIKVRTVNKNETAELNE